MLKVQISNLRNRGHPFIYLYLYLYLFIPFSGITLPKKRCKLKSVMSVALTL